MGDIACDLSKEIDSLKREFLAEGGFIDTSEFHVYRLSIRIDGQKCESTVVADINLPFSMWCMSVIEALRSAIRFVRSETTTH